MNDLFALLNSRRSVRRFKPEAPPKDAIDRLISAAVTAPSASNKQPWRFVVVTRPALISAMAGAVRDAVARIAKHVEPSFTASFEAYGDYFTRFGGAPVVIAALYRPLTVLSTLVDAKLPAADRERIDTMEKTSGLMGVAMALENLLLMAQESGLGASGMTGPLVASDRLRTFLEVPPSWEIAALVPVGIPDETPPPTQRKSAEQVTRWME